MNMHREISHLEPKDSLMLCQTHKLPTPSTVQPPTLSSYVLIQSI